MLEEIKQELDRKFDIIVYEDTENNFTAGCRNWGDWEFPEDESCDDGEDEDCDYEELTSESYNELRDFMKNLQNHYPDFSIDFYTGEKNYIDFDIARKA